MNSYPLISANTRRFALRLVFSAYALLSSLAACTQVVEFTGFGGAHLTDRFDVVGGESRIFGDIIFGINASVRTSGDFAVGVEYLRHPTDAEVVSSNLIDFDIDLSLNYIMLSAGKYFRRANPKLETLVALKIGTAGILPSEGRYNNLWRFAAGVSGGVRYMLLPRVGAQLGAHLYVPMQFSSGGFWNGEPGLANVNKFTAITQVGFTAGVIYILAMR